MMDAINVLANLEAAIEGNRWLDGLIAYHLGLMTPHFDIDPDCKDFKDWQDIGGHWASGIDGMWNKCSCITDEYFTEPLPYTTSLDSADTLGPEGWHVSHASWGLNRAAVNMVRNIISEKSKDYVCAVAETLPLARCVAAFKAIEE